MRKLLHDGILYGVGKSEERWPCGCVKGKTPHGTGWADCEVYKAEHGVYPYAESWYLSNS